MRDLVLGIDVGSSGCKVDALAADGSVVSSGSAAYATQHAHPGWASQHPQQWYDSACIAVRACMAKAALHPCQIIGLAVDGPAHGVALLGENNHVLYPTLLASDLRSTPQAAWLEQAHGTRIFEISMQRVSPSWTLSHLLWLKQREPQLFAQLRRVLVIKDYVRMRLTGDFLTDPYDAIGTQMYDVKVGAWSDELCALIGVPLNALPEVRDPFAIAGQLRAEAAHDLGLTAGIRVAVGSGDSVVEALGAGVVQPGQTTIKLATHANVNVVTPELNPSPLLITYRHVVGDCGFSIAATNSGTASLRWLQDQVLGHTAAIDFAAIDAMAQTIPAGSAGLLFHPYLLGERTPYWDADLRGSFVGLGAHHGTAHFVRAVMEGVAFSLCECLATQETHHHIPLTLNLVGGGSRLASWRQIVCDVLGRPLRKPHSEQASLGCAMIAGVASGMFADWPSAVQTCVTLDPTLEPDAATHQFYRDRFALYRETTRRLIDINHLLAREGTCVSHEQR